jgi:hypothetical protein
MSPMGLAALLASILILLLIGPIQLGSREVHGGHVGPGEELLLAPAGEGTRTERPVARPAAERYTGERP